MGKEQKELELSGAASALKYLETSVQRAQRRLDEANLVLEQSFLNQREKPDELDGSDYEILIARARAEVNDAESSLLRFSKVMLDYDKNVDTNRRDVSESITRNEAEKFFFAFAICIRGGVEQAATRQAQDAMEVKSPEDMYKLTAPLLRECLASALASAVKECQLPPWAAATIEGAL
jgi:hypothetical protein